MTIEEVREICYEIANKYNFEIPCPIKVNSRLKATLGRVKYTTNKELEVIEFSKTLLEEGTEAQINDTIRHELAHAFVFLETGKSHGHDAVWKQMCVRIGAKPERCAKSENIYIENQKTYKYSVYCSTCGKNVANYFRAGKILQNADEYSTKCCGGRLKIVQNY